MASTARLDELKKKFDENPRRYFAPLANEHRKSGDLDQAIAICRAHLPQQPGHISGHIVLAQALFETGSQEEARETFQVALGLDPENLIALRYLGDIARGTGDMPAARTWYQRVLEVDPRNDEIVQLIRELDAPPSAAPVAIEVPPAAETTSAPSAAAHAAGEQDADSVPNAGLPIAPSDSRFAPLDADEFDLDTAQMPGAAASSGSSEPPLAPEADAAPAFDVHAAWNPDSPTVELPAMDVPEHDPFAMPHSASADALFVLPAAESHEDVFARQEPVELEASPAPGDEGADAGWFDVAPVESAPAVEAHAEIVRPEIAPAEIAPAEFEEGDFYLEPAPEPPESVPASASVEEPLALSEADVVADEPVRPIGELAPVDAFEVPVPAAPEHEALPSEHAGDPSVLAPNVDSMTTAEPLAAVTPADLGDAPADDFQSPSEPEQSAIAASAATPGDELGLEVMEFVPPSAASEPAHATADAFIDPMVGRVVEPAPQESTPAAFVTETMAELYLQQGFRSEALAVYRELLARNPADESLRERIQQIESGSMSSIGAASLSEDVVESARRRQTGRPSRSVRSFFASLAGRRAPYRPIREEAPAASSVEEVTSSSTEAAAPDAPHATDPVARPTGRPEMSAAEALGSFDPFADVGDPDTVDPADTTESEGSSSSAWAPTAADPSADDSSATREPDPTTARRSLEELFPDAPVTARADAAAQTLATAFGRAEPQGRPTRAASSELSLDHVFRDAPEGTPPADGGFSFDQFFSDARAAAQDATSTTTTSDPARDAVAGDANDIEQFTAWLEGLKKK